jgi:UDP-2,3-diacylglucosamine pyrophosphatase LpxH
MPPKRKVQVLVLSDVHLGTFGCHAKELLSYLKSIKPEQVVLNGDIIDMWQFKKWYWPESHMKVLQHLLKWAMKGVPVTYLPGNHDEMLRRFPCVQFGSLRIQDKLILELEGNKTWIFHGDVFDASIQYSKWIAKLGGQGYDLLILINRALNWLSEKTGNGRISLSKRVKNSVKQAVKFVTDFETTAAELAIDQGYQTVICGHIHQPAKRWFENKTGRVRYLNSGDWIENLTALEYNDGEWELYTHALTPEWQESELEEELEDVLLPVDKAMLLGILGKSPS